MDATRRSMSRDYTQQLGWPVQMAHRAWGLVAPLADWARDDRRRLWALPLLVGVLGGLAVLPFDGLIAGWAGRIRLGGDVRREIEALQQYGQLSVSVIIAVVMALLDPARTRRLLDWGLALAMASLAATLSKMVIGRPRPVYGEPMTFLGPVGARPLMDGSAVVRPIDYGAHGVSSLWSMPSSHTTAAVVMTVFLGTMYPRLRPVVAVMVGVVAFGRMVTGAHYASDVLVGACLGAAIAGVVVSRGWGVRLLDWIWVRLVDRGAEPAWPRMQKEGLG